MWRKEHAVAILVIIGCCFGGIQKFAELDVELMDDIDIDMYWEELRDDSTLLDMAGSFDDGSTDCAETLMPATSSRFWGAL